MQYGKNRNRLQILVSQISEIIYRTDSSKSEHVNAVIVRVTLYFKKYILLNYKNLQPIFFQYKNGTTFFVVLI